MDWKTLTILLLTNMAYLFGGGAVFYALEKPNFNRQADHIMRIAQEFIGKLSCCTVIIMTMTGVCSPRPLLMYTRRYITHNNGIKQYNSQ